MRLSIVAIIFSAMIAMLIGLPILHTYERDRNKDFQHSLKSMTLSTAGSWQAGAQPDALAGWISNQGAYVLFIDRAGTLLARAPYVSVRFGSTASWQDVQEAMGELKLSCVRGYSPLAGEAIIFCSAPVVDGSNTIRGAVSLALPKEETAMREDIARRRLLFAGSMITILTLAGAAAWLYGGRLNRQLSMLFSHMLEIERDSLPAHRLPKALQQWWPLWIAQLRDLRQNIHALDRRQQLLQLAMEHITDGVIILDNRGRIQFMNPAVLRLLDLKGDESHYVGATLPQIVHDYRIVQVLRHAMESSTAEAMNPIPTEVIRDHRTFMVTASRVPSEPGAIVMMIQDITESRRLEMMRRDFLTNVSHELRTPLASLKALVETLQDSALLEDVALAQRFVQKMEYEIDELIQMVEELLSLVRLESGRSSLQKRLLKIDNLIHQTVERLHLLAERAGVQVFISLPSDLPDLQADERLIGQVLTNLVHNAIKFTPPNGEIRISAIKAEDEVIISVSDTGVGIPEEEQPRIFERFYKVDRSRVTSGVGLGLAIAKHIVLNHGGRIWVESRPGKGSTFSFSLPLNPDG